MTAQSSVSPTLNNLHCRERRKCPREANRKTNGETTASEQRKLRIALVLVGGGALGFAHIGVIDYLEQHHIPIDLVVGTSMGGLVGGLDASGHLRATADIQ